MLDEFKKFAMRGNVVDMAVGIIIGGAFGKIITSLVGDVLMPPIGKLMGGVDFSSLFVQLDKFDEKFASLKAAKDSGVPVIAYGSFLNIVIDFIIVAFCIFMMVKLMNKLKKPTPDGPATLKDCPQCLSAIPIKATRCSHCAQEVKA